MDLRLRGSKINLLRRKEPKGPDYFRPNSSISCFGRQGEFWQISNDTACRPFSADHTFNIRLKSKAESNCVTYSGYSKTLEKYMIPSTCDKGFLWDESSAESITSSNDSLGARIKCLARDSAENVNELEKEYQTPHTSEIFITRTQLSRDEIKKYGNQQLESCPKLKDHIQFDDNVEIFVKSDKITSICEDVSNKVHDDYLINTDCAISPGIMSKPPIPNRRHNGNNLMNTHHNHMQDVWSAKCIASIKDISGRVSFYNENSHIALDQYIKDDGETLSAEEEIDQILTRHEEDADKSELNSNLIMKDNKQLVQSINGQHSRKLGINEKDECTKIDNQFVYLNSFKLDTSISFREENLSGLNNEEIFTNEINKILPSEIVPVKKHTNLSHCGKPKVYVSQENKVNNEKEVNNKLNSESGLAVLIENKSTDGINPVESLIIKKENSDDTNAIINKYNKVEKTPVKHSSKNTRTFENKFIEMRPPSMTTDNRHFNEDARQFESRMSRSFSDISIAIDCLKDVVYSEMDTDSEQSQIIKDIKETFSETNYNDIDTILKTIEGEDIEFQDSVSKQLVYSAIPTYGNVNNFKSFDNNAFKKECSENASKYRLHDLLKLSKRNLGNMIISLSIQYQEQAYSILFLKNALTERKVNQEQNKKSLDKKYQDKLNSQKLEFEKIVRRHQKFIDQLINDKKALNVQCDRLIADFKTAEQRHSHNLQAIEKKYSVNLQHTKDKILAAEKLRRSRWMETHTKKIKEMTIKSMADELENLSNKYENQLKDMRLKYERESREAVVKHQQEMQHNVNSVREDMLKEKDQAILRERERFDAQLNSERQALEALNARMNEKMCAERGRLEESITLIRRSEEDARQAAETRHQRAIEKIQSLHSQQLEAYKKEHQEELNARMHDAYTEQEAARVVMLKKNLEILQDKEREIREACKIERDRQIEQVIEKIETENREMRKDIERQAENYIRGQIEKYKGQITDLLKLETELREQVLELKRKYEDSEKCKDILENNIKQLEIKLTHSQKLCGSLVAEREQIKKEIKNDFITQITILQNYIKKLNKNKDIEIEEIYNRVKLAIAKKNASLELLQAEHNRISAKCMRLQETQRDLP